MGIFYEQTEVFNVAPEAINVRFDGQDTVLKPGLNMLATIAIDKGKNQNPIKGSADPHNPSISGCQYLLRIVGVDDCTPLTKDEWEAHTGRPSRFDWETLVADRIRPGSGVKVVVGGKGKTQAKSSHDQHVRVGSPDALAGGGS